MVSNHRGVSTHTKVWTRPPARSILSVPKPSGTERMNRKPDSRSGYLHTSVAHRTRHSSARADVDSALSSKAPLRERLQACTDALVQHLDPAAPLDRGHARPVGRARSVQASRPAEGGVRDRGQAAERAPGEPPPRDPAQSRGPERTDEGPPGSVRFPEPVRMGSHAHVRLGPLA